MDITQLILSTVAALVALTIHEYAHGYVAYRLGDYTAKSMGRLSLNPIKHLDPFGVLCMIFFHFGWAKPVPIDPRNFKNPRRGFAITALAGPLTNLVVGFFTAFFYLLGISTLKYTSVAYLNALQTNLILFLFYFFLINVGLGVFNLIPVPPFDGSRILNVVLPRKWYFRIMKYEKQIYWGVIAWLFLGDNVYDMLMRVPLVANIPALRAILRIFSLSDILSGAINGIANGMLSFWSLIPALG